MDITKRQMEIVQAAIQVIARQGYEKLTTKNLANSLGVTDASLYRHFDSKKDLIKMILCYFEHLSCEVIQQIREQSLSPLDRIRRFVNNRYEMFAREPDLAMVMFSEELFKNDPSYAEYFQGIMHIHRDEVLGYIMEGQHSGSIRSDLNPLHVFRIVVGSMRLLVTQWNLTKGAFDLLGEGKLMTETIIRLIEVEK
ncbi:MAG: TetR/AcrR family transcriptional regulator [Candidatus Cloacimonetes bacterium]|jgi:AcrR family transcriptional regulator|nr:TetR/AcrR family transcriptional regulator [Candidatus Cloacimonadota bacterium]MCK9335146.1 TetR/AcrR family transcriptional regulator [Candidatus Cloacimonadota bacterium]MDD3097562.1 TetR/AcrR family transcriptional regulator [Candidatus Cloacimonadota bacterium]MDD4033946.1 TetR/AcrR family transcriptional regulator [Candidatus Cloacimonadota bacterium]MDD4668089.1 TetR/AcrR family transcriptional regulator [Candidatus Cloacimonadota bacterium]